MNEIGNVEGHVEELSRPVGSRMQKILFAIGIPANIFAAILTARITWEETSLTLQQGPQMIGFSLAHGFGAILFLSPLVLAIWLIVALITLVVSAIRKKKIGKYFSFCCIAAVVILGVLSLPTAFWQYVFIANFAKSSHAADLVTYAAAEGDRRTVEAYLNHGVSLESKNYEGSTVLFCASAGGSLEVVSMLISRGAQLNTTNLYGDSPLAAALGNKHNDVANFLQQHGAIAIDGTPEQRDAASKAIVRRDIERMNRR